MKGFFAFLQKKPKEDNPDENRKLRINGYFIERCNPFFANRRNVQIMTHYIGQDADDASRQNEGLKAALQMFTLQASRKFENTP